MNIYNFEVRTIDGDSMRLDRYRGKVLLIVNVASRCGFTPQYAELETLYRRHRDAGLEILGFPCNQFGGQEPGDEAEIKQFCTTRYEVSFPLFAKIDVNGEQAHPLYTYLKTAQKGLLGSEAIKWNFTKFLVDRRGEAVKRYAPLTAPDSIEPDLLPLLAAASDS